MFGLGSFVRTFHLCFGSRDRVCVYAFCILSSWKKDVRHVMCLLFVFWLNDVIVASDNDGDGDDDGDGGKMCFMRF